MPEGYIVVQVYTADQAIPLPDANVIVSKPAGSGEEVVRIMKTNRSGKTEIIAVPTSPASNSQTPDGTDRFFKYNIRVDYPGYRTVENVNVPVFEGQTSIQPVGMIPLPDGAENGKAVTVIEEEPFENE
ncbi:MAG: hypothetical protein J6D15_03135 [Clostridia bacterium]|nr:hypothetical protein [Clostridia bacterium]